MDTNCSSGKKLARAKNTPNFKCLESRKKIRPKKFETVSKFLEMIQYDLWFGFCDDAKRCLFQA